MNVRLLVLSLALLAGCESTPRPKTPEPSPASESKPAPALDAAPLLEVAQKLRDREFESTPKLIPVETLDAGGLPGCTSTCEDDRRALTEVLFAGKPPVVPARLAAWDRTSNEIHYAQNSPATALRAAIVAELVRALDGIKTPPATSWDGYLANNALRQGAGVFVSALDQAQQRAAKARPAAAVTAADLAARPEALFQLDFGPARFADGFATREGYAFTAALHRSGGWSTVELAHVEQPNRTLQIVRPDRYLAGDMPGQWTLPTAAAAESVGFKRAIESRVGPALFVEWLAKHVPAAVARAAYVGFETDSYALHRKPNGAWLFEWVSMWNTPTTAQQVVEALDAGLAKRDDGATFMVLRKGATVGVVGVRGEQLDLTARGTQLVDALPTFTPPSPRGVAFVPTPIDRLNSRAQVTSMPQGKWTDSATGVTIDLATLPEGWNPLPTTEPNLPWFAKHDSGAVLQFLVQPVGLFDPDFASDTYASLVNQRFTQTMELLVPTTVERTDRPIPGSLIIEAQGKIKDRPLDPAVKLHAWHFRTPDFTTTLSLTASPDVYDARRTELEPLFASVSAKADSGAGKGGVIEFSVEE